jgi:hypothetical protein
MGPFRILRIILFQKMYDFSVLVVEDSVLLHKKNLIFCTYTVDFEIYLFTQSSFIYIIID